MVIQIRLPRPGGGLLANLLGLAGLLGLAVCVGGIVGNWWVTGLVASAEAVGLSYVAQTHAAEPAAVKPAVPRAA